MKKKSLGSQLVALRWNKKTAEERKKIMAEVRSHRVKKNKKYE